MDLVWKLNGFGPYCQIGNCPLAYDFGNYNTRHIKIIILTAKITIFLKAFEFILLIIRPIYSRRFLVKVSFLICCFLEIIKTYNRVSSQVFPSVFWRINF
jgi:hypothetical protein